MKKRMFLLIISFLLLFSAIPAMAAEKPVIYRETVTVTEDGGTFNVGFVNVEFKKDFLDPSLLPATFDIEICAENGVPYIYFSPDTSDFYKKVHIRVNAYNGLLYDKAVGKNIIVHVDKLQLIVSHFSHYALVR